MKYLHLRIGFILLLASLLAMGLDGCRGPSAQISGQPLNSISTVQTLDPEKAENVAVYFFTDHPVHGLNFYCISNGAVVVQSMTDVVGRAVCPRASAITFYLGDLSQSAVMTLGSIDLKIFGATSSSASDARNYVAVTPSLFFGSVANSSNNSVANIFNLLYALDDLPAASVPASSARHIIQLQEDPQFANIHKMLARVILAHPELFTQHGSEPLSLTPANFATLFLQPLVSYLNADNATLATDRQIQFVNSGNSMSLNPGDAGYLLNVVDNAITASRAGIYRAASSAIQDSTGKLAMTPAAIWMVTRHGDVQGMGLDVAVDTTVTPAVLTYSNMNMLAGAKVGSDGQLLGVDMLNDAGTFQMNFTGGMVNGFVWSTKTDLQSSQNPLVPGSYTEQDNDIGNILADKPSIVATGSGVFNGPFAARPGEATLPDIDISSLNGVLPLTLRISLKAYKNGILATDAERTNSADWVIPPVSSLQFTIQPNGEIDSDLDTNCNPLGVSYSNGSLTDVKSGNPEYVIGQVGPVFKDSSGNPYITLLFAVYGSRTQPAYGLTLGFNGEYNPAQAVVYDVKDQKIISKSCSPATIDTCTPPEWFNDYVFTRYVMGPHIEQGISLDPLARSLQSGYYYIGRMDNTIVNPPCTP